MLTLQEQVVQKVSGLSEDNLRFLLDMIERFMQPDTMGRKETVITNRVGIAKGQDLYDNEYDFDEMNPEMWLEAIGFMSENGISDVADCR